MTSVEAVGVYPAVLPCKEIPPGLLLAGPLRPDGD